MRRPGVSRIWPFWAQSVADMIEAGAVVRFACLKCRTVYDVDVKAIAILFGRGYSLIERRPRCKASKCRDKGFFLAAPARDRPFTILTAEDVEPRWLVGARPCDFEPPEAPPPSPPAPPGVDVGQWAAASPQARKRMVRQARG